MAFNQVRVGLMTVRGASVPYPYGGKARVVAVDIDLAALQAKNLAPQDVVNASMPRISFSPAARQRSANRVQYLTKQQPRRACRTERPAH